jgi:5-methylcytosine-specific restriction endonuclease McrA
MVCYDNTMGKWPKKKMTPRRVEYLKRYRREWSAKRRAAYFYGKRCVQCGSSENLELDHVNPADKREAEIKKCQVLCRKCHRQKTNQYLRSLFLERPNFSQRKLTDEQADEVRRLAGGGMSRREIGKLFGVTHDTINGIVNGWLYVKRRDMAETAKIRTRGGTTSTASV